MSDSVKTPLTLAELDFIEAELKQWSVTDYGDVLEPFLPRLLSMARQSVEGEAVAAEDRAEQFIQAAISNAAEPLKELGQYLTSVLDEDEWPTAERYLLALAAPPPAAAVNVEEIGQKLTDPPSSGNHITDLEGSPDTQGGAAPLVDLTERNADGLSVWPNYMLETLLDPQVIHLNMLRGGIAKLTPAQIGHLYRGDEAKAVIAEVLRQNPDQGGAGEGQDVVWLDIRKTPIPETGFVLVIPTEDDVPEVWASKTYHEAVKRGPEPGWKHLVEEAARITHWSPLPKLPTAGSAEG